MPLRCCILLLYKARELWAQDFELIYLNWGGAKGIRTPDLLHAISRQHIHSSTYLQVSVSGRPYRSSQIQTGCGTFLLYSPGCPQGSIDVALLPAHLQFAPPATPVLAHAWILFICPCDRVQLMRSECGGGPRSRLCNRGS